MISPDDPRLTAHADGQLPPEEAARLERELAAAPAARAELERLRALQRELREAFAEETAEAELPARLFTPVAPPPRRPARVLAFPAWMFEAVAAVFAIGILAALIVPSVGKVRETARRSVDSSNLRQIGQACLIYASGHEDRLPVATDVWDFARQLALDAGLNDASVWFIPSDSAALDVAGVSTVLTPDRAALHPAFARSRPAFAVVLGGLTTSDPSTTPVAWTRGLREDGTWAPDSPYRGEGGHIVFLGGNVSFYRNVKGQLLRHDGQGVTGNILEALPLGARVGDATAPPPAPALP